MNKNAVIKHARDNRKRARKARSEFERALHLLIADAWMQRAHAGEGNYGDGSATQSAGER
jgi:hypothetical protein